MRVKFAEEFTIPKSDELRAVAAWSNVHPIILQVGRCSHLVPDGIEEPDAYREEKEATDPSVERFRGLEEHVPMGENDPAWSSKVVGDTGSYTDGAEGEVVSYAINVIKSNRWPGAITVSKGGKFTNLYVGYGLKKGAAKGPSFQPLSLADVQADPEEDLEQDEPQGKLEDPNAPKPDDGDDAAGDDD